MTETPTPKAAPTAPKSNQVEGSVYVPTTDLVAGVVTDGAGEDAFRAEHEGKTLTNLKLVGKRHDIGHGVTYDFTADVK